MTPRISIIIPVYHVEKYIYVCLQSVADQTMTEGIECIIVDDCGGDNSIAIAKDFISTYDGPIDFKIVYRESNGGLSAARNSGIEASTGEYLYFLDSDDELVPDCMEQMWLMIEKYGNVDLVKGAFFEEDSSRNINSINSMPEYSSDRKLIKRFLLRYEGDLIPAQSKLLRKDFVINHQLYFKEGIIHEDNYWSFFLAKFVSSLCCSPKAIYKHRYNPSSITGNINIKKESLAYKTIIKDLCENIDSFLIGHQKEYILSNFITALSANYFESEYNKNKVISSIKSQNNYIENILLDCFLKIHNRWFKEKAHHLLLRLYKTK